MYDESGSLSSRYLRVSNPPLSSTYSPAVCLFIGALGRVDGKGHFAPNIAPLDTIAIHRTRLFIPSTLNKLQLFPTPTCPSNITPPPPPPAVPTCSLWALWRRRKGSRSPWAPGRHGIPRVGPRSRPRTAESARPTRPAAGVAARRDRTRPCPDGGTGWCEWVLWLVSVVMREPWIPWGRQSMLLVHVKGSMSPSIGHMELLVWMQRADFSEHIQGCKSPGDPLNSSHFHAPNTKFAPTGYRRAPNIISHHYKQ